jgi:poly(3-hydroxybutyrate) depolymerase
MTTRKIVIRAVLVLIALSIVSVLLAFGFFYFVFYFPNRTSATAGTIVSSGQKRNYLLYIPKSYDPAKPTPLIITLHTSMSWDSAAMAISQWNSVADDNGFLVVYPEGTGRGPKSWAMVGSETPARMPDVLFIAALIDKLGASYNIDQTRIYANGMSNGGGMAFVLSCTLSDRIAAVGMVSAGLDPDWNWCTDHRPVPVIAFHGTGDPICPYNGGPSKLGGGMFPNVPEFFAEWSRRNQCGPNPKSVRRGRPNKGVQRTLRGSVQTATDPPSWLQVRTETDADENEDQCRDLLPLFRLPKGGGHGYCERHLQPVQNETGTLKWQRRRSSGRMQHGTLSAAAPRSAQGANTVTPSDLQSAFGEFRGILLNRVSI